MANKLKDIFKNMLSVKNADDLISASKHSELKKTLNVFDLIILGIGAVVGTGIFTIVGIAAQGGNGGIAAGPALSISMIIAALSCIFSALCYSEFASMIPVAGSAYTYTYATMGEFMAWMVGWILMLEYAIGNITVASAWTGYFMQFLKGFDHVLPGWLVNPPIWLVNDYRTALAICDKTGVNPHDTCGLVPCDRGFLLFFGHFSSLLQIVCPVIRLVAVLVPYALIAIREEGGSY